MSIQIPETMEELTECLSGVHKLLTATQWERAAIVYAFTELGGPRNTPTHQPKAPKMTILGFARQGFAGLTTPKAVKRYRRAWEDAIYQGWATVATPGATVPLPTQDFPAWEDTVADGVRRVGQAHRAQLMSALDSVRARILRCQGLVQTARIGPQLTEEVVLLVSDIEHEVKTLRDLANTLLEENLTPEQIATARKRWEEF